MGANDQLQIALPNLKLVKAEIERRKKIPKPQPGPQTLFYNTIADVAIYGGAAGAGKTYALLMDPLRHVRNPQFSSVIFRRETPQIRNPGGLWDESTTMYAPLGVQSLSSPLEHRFPNGAVIKFAHLERDETVLGWDGSQVPMIGFDQLEHFTAKQFWYMFSRNRSACGVQPYIRATCNPNADSWLAKFIEWWIDQKTGFPIAERSGVLRWFIRDGDDIHWADSEQELMKRFWRAELPPNHPDQPQPKSVTFIPGTVYDNKALLSVDPRYLANLKALNAVERARLLGGNWKVKASAGLLFRREWCEVVDVLPPDCDFVRYWDRAGTEKTHDNDPDFTVGIKLARRRSNGKYILCDARRMQVSPGKVEDAIHNTASDDGRNCRVGIPQDPGQAGKGQAQDTIRRMDGYAVSAWIESGDKVTRFGPFSAQAEAGNVQILRGFNEETLRVLENFPDGRYKDDADACSGAFEMFNNAKGQGIRDWMQRQAEAEAAKAVVPVAAQSNGGSSFMKAIA